METGKPNYLFSLPPEIRREIYLLASPPRLIRLQERFDEDYEDFVEEIRTSFSRLNLDSSLTHFAFNWSIAVKPGRQRRLESFGFTSNKARRHPWLSASTPEIPSDWLEEAPAMAWELARKSHFYSNAVIPPLLHVSRETRAEMMNLGYQLFFRTRSSQPRTWFNVNYDILFARDLVHEWSSNHEFLSGCDWDFGQFVPDEMKLLRRLALQDGSMYFSAPGPPPNAWKITTILRLFPRLSELLLLGWIEENRHTGRFLLPDGHRHAWYEHGQDKQPSEPWILTPSEEIDCILALFPPETDWRMGTWAGGSYGELLTAYKKEHGHDASYLEAASLRMQRQLTEVMENIIKEHLDTPLDRWNIPRFTAAQALPPSWIERQREERQMLRQNLGELQREWKLIQESQADSVKHSSNGIYGERKFVSFHWENLASHDCSYCGSDCQEWPRFQETKRWWIQEGPRM